MHHAISFGGDPDCGCVFSGAAIGVMVTCVMGICVMVTCVMVIFGGAIVAMMFVVRANAAKEIFVVDFVLAVSVMNGVELAPEEHGAGVHGAGVLGEAATDEEAVQVEGMGGCFLQVRGL